MRDHAVYFFRRGVVVAASLIVGFQTCLFGVWLLLPGTTFSISSSYRIMGQLAPEELWGESFAILGGALVWVGLTLWLRLRAPRPVPAWFRAVSAGALLLKLLFVVSIFYLAARESTATPVFGVMMGAVFVLLLSALDELEVLEVLGRATRWLRTALCRR